VQDARRNGQDAYHPEEVSHSKIDFAGTERVPVPTSLFRHYVEEFRTELFLVVNKMVCRDLQPDTVPTQALVSPRVLQGHTVVNGLRHSGQDVNQML
jgi:hypothetical protein